MHIFIPYFYSSYHVSLLFCFYSKSEKKNKGNVVILSHPHYTSLSIYNPSFLSPSTPFFFRARESKKIVQISQSQNSKIPLILHTSHQSSWPNHPLYIVPQFQCPSTGELNENGAETQHKTTTIFLPFSKIKNSQSHLKLIT
jgi:hypothetical protein